MPSMKPVRPIARTLLRVFPVLWAFAAQTLLAASPGAGAASHKWPFPWLTTPDVSQDGWRADALFWYTTLMAVIAFTLVALAMVYFSVKYRARPGHRAV